MANPLQYEDTDFTTSGGVVDPEQLRQEFAAASFPSTPVVFSGRIDTSGVGPTLTVDVYFDTDPDPTDEAAADAIIAAHDATGASPSPPPLVPEVPVDRIQGRLTVGKAGSVDYTSIKEAIDAALAIGVDANNWYFIEVSPGTYVEDPMTVPTGIFVVGVSHGVAVDGVFVEPTTPASTLFSLAGGICTGINASGVTGSGEACFKTTVAGVVNACTACSAAGCTNGFMADGAGVSLVVANCTVVITGLNQTVSEAGYRASNGARVLGDGLLASAAAALLPFYTENPIERVCWAENGSLLSIATCYFGVAPKNANQKGILCDGGSLAVLTATTLEGPYTGLEIGSGGSDSKFVVQGSSLRLCTVDFSIQSATGLISASCSVDKVPVTDIVAGGVLAGTIFDTENAITEERGPGEYRYDSDRSFPLPRFYFEEVSSGLSEGGGVTDGGGLTVDVEAGSGWAVRTVEQDSTYVEWGAATGVAITASMVNYVFVDGTSTPGVSTSVPGGENVLLAIVVADGSGIRFIHAAQSPVAHSEQLLHDYLIATRKFALNTGLAVSQGSGATKLDVSVGSYYRALYLISYAGSGGDATWSYFYGTNGATEVPSVTDLSTTQYDNAGTLTAMSAGFFRADTVILTSDGRLSVVYGTEEFATQGAAEAAGVANVPTFMEESGITLALVIVEEAVGIASILDARPSPDATAGGGSGGGGGVSDHGALSGLGDDDHTQYLLTSGTRAMGGSLNMGTNAITNVGTVDGVDVSAHASRHNPGQVDELATAAAVAASVGQANGVGSAASFARSDHTHAHAAGTPVNATKAANAEGVATTFARSDHKHDVSTAAAGAIAIGDAAAEGAATTLARSDHTHSLAAPAAPVNVTKAAASAGASAAPARADHKHDITTAAPAVAGVGTTSGEGVATTLARSDHSHQANTAPVNVTKAAAAIGTSTQPARADHKHDVNTAAPSTGIGGANSEGSSTSLARADHNHALRTTTGPTDLTIGAIATGQFLQRVGTTVVGGTPGDVTGPASAVDNRLVRFDGTTGKLIQSSGAALSDGDDLTLLDTVTFGTTMETDVQSGASLTIDFTENQKKRITLSANITAITITAPPGIGNFMVEFIQDSTNRTLSGWPASLRWAREQGAPVMPQGSGAVLLIGMFYNGTVYRAHWTTYSS